MPRLRRSDCSSPGIARRRRGRGFEYLDEDGRRIDSQETLDRIRTLSIPPAWKDVWICPLPNGHLQATGIDAAGRKQYLYHEAWRARREQEKFDQMLDFARALPRMRRTVAGDLRREDVDRKRVLACAVRLLDRGLFRIGSESYAEQNESFGLATIQKDHVRLNGTAIEFDYPAKSGIRRIQTVVDPDAKQIVELLKRRRGGGQELLAFKTKARWSDVGSTDINEYIKEATGGDFTAKDFRTWNATVLAAMALAMSDVATSRTARKRAIREAIKGAAVFLGNTPAVARSSYIDPRVFDRYLSGWTISGPLARKGKSPVGELPTSRRSIEKAVLDLITEQR
jgi:DNA topoisomerase I